MGHLPSLEDVLRCNKEGRRRRGELRADSLAPHALEEGGSAQIGGDVSAGLSGSGLDDQFHHAFLGAIYREGFLKPCAVHREIISRFQAGIHDLDGP